MTPSEVCEPLRKLRPLALRFCNGSAHDADDLLQDTAELALRARDRADPARLTGWLATIMRRRKVDLVRLYLADLRRVARPPTPPPTQPDAEPVTLLHEVIRAMPKADRETFACLLLQQAPLTSTQKNRVIRARERLQHALGGAL